MAEDCFSKTQNVAAGFAHELGGPIGSIGHAVELLAEQMRNLLDKADLKYFEAGINAGLTPVSSPKDVRKDIPARLARRLAMAQIKSPAMAHELDRLDEAALDRALQLYEIGFSLRCSMLGVDTSTRIIKNLRNWGDWTDLWHDEVDLGQTIQSAWTVAGYALKNLVISWQLGDVPLIKANPYALSQVWMNIFKNASETSEEMVRLSITVSMQGKHIEITFENDGPPLPTGIELFGKGQTTKATGHGLGLSMCREIVERHGGTIKAENVLDTGVVFIIELPLPTK